MAPKTTYYSARDYYYYEAERSACLTTNQEIADSIPGTSTILKVGQVWNGAYPAS
jgi:hypothetical protein